MSAELRKISDELQDIKKQMSQLSDEINSLKDNYQSLGYNSDDNILSDEEKQELVKIRDAIKKGDYSDLTEL